MGGREVKMPGGPFDQSFHVWPSTLPGRMTKMGWERSAAQGAHGYRAKAHPSGYVFDWIVRGDSMTGAQILDGDTIVLEYKNPLEPDRCISIFLVETHVL